ncbi:MAG: ABC transporter permease [Saprospiraceae bacterium]|nr:ABC transporter permease [Saprospiraceae bacterium]
MHWNSLNIAFRSLRRERFFTLLNISGLAAGLAAAVLLLLWVQDELSFDRFHSRSDRIYRVLTNWQFDDDREWIAQTPAPLVEEGRASIPEAAQMARTWRLASQTIFYGAARTEMEKMLIVENGFFRSFDFPFLKGNAATALADPKNIVCTEKAAREIFGELPEIGEIVRVGEKGEFRLGGILYDLPSNSSLNFNCLIPWEGNAVRFARRPENAFSWSQFNFTAWVLLRPEASPASAAAKFSAIAAPHRSGDESIFFALQNIRDIHLYSTFLRWGGSGNLQTIRIAAIIALLILSIACINYVNLTAARSAQRARAIGIRKTIGATRWHLFRQSMLESGLTVGMAALLAVVLVQLALPYFEEFSGKDFTVGQLRNWTSYRVIGAAALLAWLLSGVQPALQLTRFQAVEAMKGQVLGKEKTTLRKILVTAQFVCSIGLGICALVIAQQLKYVREANLGYERDHIFSFSLPDDKGLMFKTELQKSKTIRSVTLSDNSLVDLGSQCSGDTWEGKLPEQPSELWQINVDSDFPAFFGLQLAAGRWFREGNADSSSFVLNESAVRMMQLDNPVGKWMEHGGRKGSIVGVVRDFHFKSLHSAIEPMIFEQHPDFFYTVYIKTSGDAAQTAIAETETMYQSMFANKVFKYEFVDEQYDQLYRTESRTGQIIGLFTGLTLFISCLGLFGLAAFAAVRRTKEIGVRKVLGASSVSIAGLLSADFIKLILLSIVLAAPLAWYLMQGWLANFAYHIEVQVWMVAAVGVVAMGIATLTVSFHSLKAALTNPVVSLRNE